jgi:outer membrane protein assembly factor BamA
VGQRRSPGLSALGLILAGLALAVLFLPGTAPAEEVWEAPEVRRIDFIGNRHLPEARLRSVMRHRQRSSWNPLRRPRYLGRDVLAQDLEAVLGLYREEGFPFARILDAAVIYDATGTSVVIEIRLEEGPQVLVREVVLEGVRPAFRKELRRRIQTRPDEILRPSVLEGDRQRILEFYAEKGMATTRVEAETRFVDDSLRADVFLRVEEGPVIVVRQVLIPGEHRTHAGVVRRLLRLRPGEALVRSRLLESQQRLLETGLFRSVHIVPMMDTTSLAVADLQVRLSEKPPGWYGAGAGFSSDDELRLVAEWGYRNLGGRWRMLQTNGRLKYSLDRSLGNEALILREGALELRYTEPFLFGSLTSSQTLLHYTFLREIAFEQKLGGLIQSFRRELPEKWIAHLNFEIRWVSTTDTTALRPSYRTHVTTLHLLQDLRDNIFDPSRGHQYRLSVDYAGGFLGGKNEFFRTTATASWYARLKTGVVVALRLRGGLITPLGKPVAGLTPDSLQVTRVPFEDRYRLGGGTSVRGYRENSLGRRTSEGQSIGGLALFLGNLEIRFPLVWRFQGALFLDAGNVWADPSEFKLRRLKDGWTHGEYNPLAVAYSLGFGIRFRTPVGPLRADYGLKVGQDPPSGEADHEFHLSLGQAF